MNVDPIVRVLHAARAAVTRQKANGGQAMLTVLPDTFARGIGIEPAELMNCLVRLLPRVGFSIDDRDRLVLWLPRPGHQQKPPRDLAALIGTQMSMAVIIDPFSTSPIRSRVRPLETLRRRRREIAQRNRSQGDNL